MSNNQTLTANAEAISSLLSRYNGTESCPLRLEEFANVNANRIHLQADGVDITVKGRPEELIEFLRQFQFRDWVTVEGYRNQAFHLKDRIAIDVFESYF